MANLEKGRGTVGGLMVDPSVYEDLKTILGNVQRNVLLKALIRFTIKQGDIERPAHLRTRRVPEARRRERDPGAPIPTGPGRARGAADGSARRPWCRHRRLRRLTASPSAPAAATSGRPARPRYRAARGQAPCARAYRPRSGPRTSPPRSATTPPAPRPRARARAPRRRRARSARAAGRAVLARGSSDPQRPAASRSARPRSAD